MPLITLPSGRIVAKGLLPTSRGKLSAAFNPLSEARMRALAPPPASVVNSLGMTLDPFGNGGLPDPADTSYGGEPLGDCTIAMVANVMMALALRTGLSGAPLVFLAKTIVAYYLARTGGADTGLNIMDVLNWLETIPLSDASGNQWTFGPSGVVSYENAAMVQQSIYLFKGVLCGVDASGLQQVAGDLNGWVLTGITRKIENYDHAVPALDYGEAGALFDAWKINLPTNSIGATDQGYGIPTWGTKGFVDVESFQNMTGESHVVITASCRGDSATWNPIAATDFADLTGATPPVPVPVPPAPIPTPVPNPPAPTPRPRPCPRMQDFLDAHPDIHDALREALFSDLIGRR